MTADFFEEQCGASLHRQGAEARLYTGTYLGRPVIIKHRFPKTYRHPQLDAQLTRDRLRAEVRSLVRCKTLGIRTPTIYLADVDSGVIVMEYFSSAVTARDYIRARMAEEPFKSKPETHPELQRLAVEVGSTLGKLHANNIIHGDLTTSNMLIDGEGGMILIDFGLGFAEGSAEDKGVDIYVLERALISTHPHSEALFELMREAYNAAFSNKKERAEITRKYEEIRLRGRKRTMVG